jgi:hypothetical protein
VNCFNVSPLIHGNWPMLTYLRLTILKREETVSYLADLTFTKSSMKELHLIIYKDTNTSFLGHLLKSSPELESLVIVPLVHSHDSICLTNKMASMIASTPLIQLHQFTLASTGIAGPNFSPTFFGRDYTALKRLDISHDSKEIVPLLTTKNWLKHLEEIFLSASKETSIKDLQSFLQNLQKGAVTKLTLHSLPIFVVLEGFKNIHLDHLKSLTVHSSLGLQSGTDISEFVNVLFDSCSLLKLEEIAVGTD